MKSTWIVKLKISYSIKIYIVLVLIILLLIRYHTDEVPYTITRNQELSLLVQLIKIIKRTCLITLTLDNQKRFWSLVKRLRKNFDEPVATLYADYNLKTTPVSTTEALNQQFHLVFTRPGFSCQTQLVLLVDEILKAIWAPTIK